MSIKTITPALKKNALRIFVLSLLFFIFYALWRINSSHSSLIHAHTQNMASLLIIAITSLQLMTCIVFSEKRGKKKTARLGQLIILLSSLFWFWGIWAEAADFEFWNFAIISTLISMSISYGFVLNSFWLDKRFRFLQKLVFPTLLVFILASTHFILNFKTLGFKQDTTIDQFAFATSVIIALLTLLIPTLHKLSIPKIGMLPKKLKLNIDSGDIYRDQWGIKYQITPLVDQISLASEKKYQE